MEQGEGLTTINGVDLFYRDLGNGTPVLFIHGFPLTGDIWRYQAEALSSRARVIVPDLRGFGKSGVTAGPYSMDMFARDLKGLLGALRIETAVLAGISMGGYIALSFYRLFSATVKALVLLDTRAGADSEEGRKGRMDLARRARGGEMGRIADEWIEKLFTASTITTKPDIVLKVKNAISRSAPEAIAGAALGMMERPDSTPMLRDITCPVLIMVGEQDRLTPVDDAKAMAAKIKRSRLEVIQNAGHLSCLEAPEQVNRRMQEFLSGIQA